MATRYLTVAELKDYVRTELQTEDAIYEDSIKTAEDIIDEATGRQFIVATTATARSFDVPLNSCRLVINDCTAVTSIVDNAVTLVANVDYKLYPLGGLSITGRSVPYSSVVRLGGGFEMYWQYWGLPAQVVITATWGWPSIPSLVKTACKIIAKDVFLTRDTTFGIVALTEVGGVGSRENDVVRKMLAAFPHANSIGIA